MSDYRYVVVETCRPQGSSGITSIYVRPVSGQGYAEDMHVECSRKLISEHPIGTHFRIRAKQTEAYGVPFLYSYYKWDYDVLTTERPATPRAKSLTGTHSESDRSGPAYKSQRQNSQASLNAYQRRLNREIRVSEQLTRRARKYRLLRAPRLPEQMVVMTTVFKRNADVIVEALLRASGACEECKQAAPFHRRSDRTPYLEVHHRMPLAKGGEDTLENAIALCPNCHRKAHYA